MESTIGHLLERIRKKGIKPQEIPQFIGDTLIILHDSGEFSVENINRKLGNRGWNEQVVDEGTLELIASLLEGMRNFGDGETVVF
jgi:hypothetical protein